MVHPIFWILQKYQVFKIEMNIVITTGLYCLIKYFKFTMHGKAVLFRPVAPAWCHLDLRISKSSDAVSCHGFFRQQATILCGFEWFADWLNWCVSKCWCHGKGIPLLPWLLSACQKYCPNWSSLTLTFPRSSPHASVCLRAFCLVISCSAVSPLSH